MLPEYEKSQMAPYLREFNMVPGVDQVAAARGSSFGGSTRGPAVPGSPFWHGYPVMYAGANNYAAMSTGSNTSMQGTPGDTSAGDRAADAIGGAPGDGADGGGDGGGSGM